MVNITKASVVKLWLLTRKYSMRWLMLWSHSHFPAGLWWSYPEPLRSPLKVHGVRLCLFTATSHGIMCTCWYPVCKQTGGSTLKTEQNMTWTWNDSVQPQCRGIVSGMRLTWAWWWHKKGTLHSWGGRCPSWLCLSPWRPASCSGVGCTPGWSGPAGCHAARLARCSDAPTAQKTGDSGCSPSVQGLGAALGHWYILSGLCHIAETELSTSACSPTGLRSQTGPYGLSASCQTCWSSWGRSRHWRQTSWSWQVPASAP